MEIKAAHWLNYYSDWLQNNPPENILVLHFENLQQNLKWVLVQQIFLHLKHEKCEKANSPKFWFILFSLLWLLTIWTKNNWNVLKNSYYLENMLFRYYLIQIPIYCLDSPWGGFLHSLATKKIQGVWTAPFIIQQASISSNVKSPVQ